MDDSQTDKNVQMSGPDGSGSRREFFQKVTLSAAAAGLGASHLSAEDTAVPHDDGKSDIHICKGLNRATQDGKEAGQCDCATADQHGCQGGNSCNGQGGCGTGDYQTQYWVGENLCGKYGANPDGSPKWNGTGGCGVPLGFSNTGFIGTQLNNAVPTPTDNPDNLTPVLVGVSVWAIARARFEEKMVKQNLGFKAPEDTSEPFSLANAWQPGQPYDKGQLPEPYPEPVPLLTKPVSP